MPEVLLIGWDGAGWNQIHPLLNSGDMPNLARLVEKGVMGDLATLTPLCPSLLWTSVATGQYGDRHGVLDTLEPDPRTDGVRPATRASLREPQIWDILAREGVRSQAIGWPVTHPAGTSATCVSDGFAFGIPQSVYPQALESTLLPLRFQPQEWTGDELQLFVPGLAKIDQDKDKRLAQLAVILAEAASVHAAATTLMETAPCDFTAVWFAAVGRACGVFPSGTDEIYQDVIGGVYRFLDLLLGRLLTLAGPDATVMLVSDRAAGEPEWSASAGIGPRGMLCAAGPGIEPDELTFGSGLLDVAPTILGLYGFAPAPGMPGRPIYEICRQPPVRQVQKIVSAPRPDRMTPELERDLAELAAMGYEDSIAVSTKPAAESARQRRDFHLGRVLLAQGRSGEAIPLFEGLTRDQPAATEIRMYLAHAYFQSARYPECRAICEALLADSPDSALVPLARAHLAIAEGSPRDAKAHLAAGQEAYGMVAALDAAIGLTYLRLKSWEEAAAAFRSAIAKDRGLAAAHEGLAQALLAGAHYEEAAEAALDAIRLRYDQPGAHRVLGQSLRALGREEAAVGAFAVSDMLDRRIPAQ